MSSPIYFVIPAECIHHLPSLGGNFVCVCVCIYHKGSSALLFTAQWATGKLGVHILSLTPGFNRKCGAFQGFLLATFVTFCTKCDEISSEIGIVYSLSLTECLVEGPFYTPLTTGSHHPSLVLLVIHHTTNTFLNSIFTEFYMPLSLHI